MNEKEKLPLRLGVGAIVLNEKNKVFVGKREDKHSVSQDIISSIMVKEASKGNIVVRLKGGDPFIFD